MTAAVQRVRSPEGGEVSYTVIGPDGLPVGPVEAFLAHLSAVGRAPNTVEGYAHDLRDFLEGAEDNQVVVGGKAEDIDAAG